jgi:hypothetical protein
MNPRVMTDANLQQRIRTDWEKWITLQHHYPDITVWWERCIKRRLQILLRQVQSERNKDLKRTENHLYHCLHDIVRKPMPENAKFLHLQR